MKRATAVAVPLTPDEAAFLVQAFQEEDRLTRKHRPDIGGGSAYSRDKAKGLLRTSGAAAALGHSTVPLLADDLRMFEYTLLSLQRWAPDSQTTRDFEALLNKLQALSGVAQIKKWTVEMGDAGWQWKQEPSAADSSDPRTRGAIQR